MNNQIEIVRDAHLEPLHPPFQLETRVFFKPKAIAVIFLIVGAAAGFVYGFLTV